jgi:DeoR family fructose operon transcriptional repressor
MPDPPPLNQPADAAIFAEERREHIARLVAEAGKVTVAGLSEQFGVTGATIRTDLRDLQHQGLLLRTHGGAIRATKTGQEYPFAQREVQNLAAKQAIAATALDLVDDGDRIILDTGTTTLELARLLGRRRDLTVVTNDLEIARTLEETGDAAVVVLGGTLRRGFHCTLPLPGDSLLAQLWADKVFVAANSFTPTRGATTPDPHQAATKRLMIAAAEKTILLCDRSKFGRASFAQFASLDEIDTLVTDGLPEDWSRLLEEVGVEVLATDAENRT